MSPSGTAGLTLFVFLRVLVLLVVQTGAGLYLFFGGKFVVNMVFRKSLPTEKD